MQNKLSNPRLRMIAGPNGSGKSTLLERLRKNFRFPLGYCLNPDELGEQLRSHRQVHLGWQAGTEEFELHDFLRVHPLAGKLGGKLPSLRANVLTVESGLPIDYFVVMLCDFLRQKWMALRESFTFETVMSHPSKIELLRSALDLQYRTYLYFVCTANVMINTERIANRVRLGGHDVDAETVKNRFARSVSLLPEAIRNSSRAYVFDNSGQTCRLVAEFNEARIVMVSSDLPQWFLSSGWERFR